MTDPPSPRPSVSSRSSAQRSRFRVIKRTPVTKTGRKCFVVLRPRNTTGTGVTDIRDSRSSSAHIRIGGQDPSAVPRRSSRISVRAGCLTASGVIVVVVVVVGYKRRGRFFSPFSSGPLYAFPFTRGHKEGGRMDARAPVYPPPPPPPPNNNAPSPKKISSSTRVPPYQPTRL